MHVLVAGGTGFVGRALALRLQRDGHSVHALVRDPRRAASLLGPGVHLVADSAGATALRDALSRCDAVVNLAGEPVLPARWTERRRAAITGSRVAFTRALVRAMRDASPRPSVFVSASAVGYYGTHPRAVVDETAPPGQDFLARLCQDWESEAMAAAGFNARVVLPRIGVVLGPGGGILARMVPAFRAGVGGALGTGLQPMPWVHVEDLVEALTLALTDPAWSGPINVAAAHPPANRQFTAALASRLGVRAPFTVPAFVLRLGLGQASEALLTGPDVDPRRLRELGFTPRHATLEAALDDLLGPATGPTFEPCCRLPHAPYVIQRPPRWTLRSTVTLGAPLTECAPFFERVENLGLLVPSAFGFETEDGFRPIEAGAEIVHRVRLGALRLRWRTRIESSTPGEGFVDVQERGPFRSWWHDHRYREEGGHSVIEDVVHHAVPFGALGDLVHALAVKHRLDGLWRFRRLALLLRFGRP